eukprot:Skav221058  [mRNA]  locus=scaffold4018:55730:66968:- [translate_table: standard]
MIVLLDTVEQLKGQICELQGLPVDEQKLIFAGRSLDSTERHQKREKPLQVPMSRIRIPTGAPLEATVEQLKTLISLQSEATLVRAIWGAVVHHGQQCLP